MASTSPQIDSPCQCARCQNMVRVQGHAKAGNFPSQFYLHVCAYKSHIAPLLTTSIQCMSCYWHYMFPVDISPTNTAFPEAPVSRHTGLGISQPNKKNACSGCLGQLCGRSTHGSWGNRCCHTCCIINGICCLVSYTDLSITNDS